MAVSLWVVLIVVVVLALGGWGLYTWWAASSTTSAGAGGSGGSGGGGGGGGSQTPPPPSTPRSVSFSQPAGTTATLTWVAPSTNANLVTGYAVAYSTSLSGGSLVSPTTVTLPSTAVSYTITGLPYGSPVYATVSATYAGGAIPSSVLTGATLQQGLATPAGWNTAILTALKNLKANGTGLVQISVVGDSISAGVGASNIYPPSTVASECGTSWVSQLGGALQAQYGDGGSGLVLACQRQDFASNGAYPDLQYGGVPANPTTPFSVTYPCPVQATGTLSTKTEDVTCGMPGAYSLTVAGSGALTFVVRGTNIAVYYIGGSGLGTFSVSIDGAATVTPPNQTTGALAYAVWTTTASAGWHTVAITMSGTVYIGGVSGTNASGVVVHNMAVPGLAMYNFGGITTAANSITYNGYTYNIQPGYANIYDANGGTAFAGQAGSLQSSLLIVALSANDHGVLTDIPQTYPGPISASGVISGPLLTTVNLSGATMVATGASITIPVASTTGIVAGNIVWVGNSGGFVNAAGTYVLVTTVGASSFTGKALGVSNSQPGHPFVPQTAGQTLSSGFQVYGVIDSSSTTASVQQVAPNQPTSVGVVNGTYFAAGQLVWIGPTATMDSTGAFFWVTGVAGNTLSLQGSGLTSTSVGTTIASGSVVLSTVPPSGNNGNGSPSGWPASNAGLVTAYNAFMTGARAALPASNQSVLLVATPTGGNGSDGQFDTPSALLNRDAIVSTIGPTYGCATLDLTAGITLSGAANGVWTVGDETSWAGGVADGYFGFGNGTRAAAGASGNTAVPGQNQPTSGRLESTSSTIHPGNAGHAMIASAVATAILAA